MDPQPLQHTPSMVATDIQNITTRNRFANFCCPRHSANNTPKPIGSWITLCMVIFFLVDIVHQQNPLSQSILLDFVGLNIFDAAQKPPRGMLFVKALGRLPEHFQKNSPCPNLFEVPMKFLIGLPRLSNRIQKGSRIGFANSCCCWFMFLLPILSSDSKTSRPVTSCVSGPSFESPLGSSEHIHASQGLHCDNFHQSSQAVQAERLKVQGHPPAALLKRLTSGPASTKHRQSNENCLHGSAAPLLLKAETVRKNCCNPTPFKLLTRGCRCLRQRCSGGNKIASGSPQQQSLNQRSNSGDQAK